MPGIPISALPTTTTVSPSAILILDQNGTTYQSTVTQILTNVTPVTGGYGVGSLSQLSDVKDTGTHFPTNGQVLTWNTSLSAWIPSTVSSSGGSNGSGLTTASVPSIVQNSAWSGNRPSTVSLPSAPTPGNLVIAMTSLHPNSYSGTTGFITIAYPQYSDEAFLIQALVVQSGDTGTYSCGSWGDDGAIMLFEVTPGGISSAYSNPVGTNTVTNLPGPIAVPIFAEGIALVGYSSEEVTSTGAAPGWTDYGNSGTHHGGAVHGRVFNQTGAIQDTFSGTVTSENMAAAMIIITPQIESGGSSGSTSGATFSALASAFIPASYGQTSVMTFSTPATASGYVVGETIQVPYSDGSAPYVGQITAINGNSMTVYTPYPTSISFYENPTDIPPANPSIYDDEFISNSLNTKWTFHNPTPANTNRQVICGATPSLAYIDNPYTTTDRVLFIDQAAPSGAFTITAKMGMTAYQGSYSGPVLYFSDGTNLGTFNAITINGGPPSSGGGSKYTYSSYSYNGDYGTGLYTQPNLSIIYLRFKFDGTNVYFYVSSNGFFSTSSLMGTDSLSNAGISSGTITRIGWGLFAYSAASTIYCDWFRVTIP